MGKLLSMYLNMINSLVWVLHRNFLKMELKDKKEALLEYARFYGIARDHLECSPFESLPFLLEYLHKEPDDSHEDFSDFGEIEAAARSPLPERLTIDRHSLTYLRELRTEEQLIPQWELLPELDPHRIRNLKQELPLLRTDHETDMLDFPRRMEVDLKNEFIPLEKVDEEQDEGLTWPTKYKDFADAYFKDLREEKLGISRDVLAYMQDALDFDLESEQFAFEYEKTARTKVCTHFSRTLPKLIIDLRESIHYKLTHP